MRASACGLFLAAATAAAQDDAFRTTATQEVSAGGMVRLLNRDPGLIGGGNGGTGTSINYDDGNLNYGRGLTSLATQGRTTIDVASRASELKLEAVYFYDAINADGDTDFHPLSGEARDRVGRGIYLNDAYIGYRGHLGDAALGVRLGNQILRWSESPSFGPSMAPVNPISASRRYQPGNTARDLSVALPMLSAMLTSAPGWSLQAFYQFGFKPTELEAAGSFLSGNDYYSPGARYLQLGFGSPAVPDTDQSVITMPDTRFGSKVARDPDRMPGSGGQFGVRLESPPLGDAKLTLAGYAMRIHAREPIVSVRTGTLGGLLGTTAPDYTSSGAYFVEYVPHVTVLGSSARFSPAAHTRVNLDYSNRLRQPLQIDDDVLITAGLAPAAAVAACGPPATPFCPGTLATLNQNPIVASRGGITAANAASFFATEINGYERFNVSQYSASVAQGLAGILGSSQSLLAGEIGGLYIHGYKPDFLDATVSIRPDDSGRRRIGLASRSAWGYRLGARLDYPGVLGMQTVSPSVFWIHDVRGNAPITLGTFLEGSESLILATDFTVDKSLAARIAYRTYLAKGSNADRFSDRDFIALSLTRKF